MTFTKAAEWDRLAAEHPEVIESELHADEIVDRYWMYFSQRVGWARAEVHWRRLTATVLAPLERITDRLTRATR